MGGVVVHQRKPGGRHRCVGMVADHGHRDLQEGQLRARPAGARKLRDEVVEVVGPLDLGPVTAAGEHGEVRVGQQPDHVPGDLHRDHLVLAAVHQQRPGGDRLDLLFGDAQLASGMPGAEEHVPVGFEGARRDTGLIPGPDQIIGDDRRVHREVAEQQLAHVLLGRLVFAQRPEPVGERHADAGSTHEHHPVQPVRALRRHAQPDPPAQRVAHQRRLLGCPARPGTTETWSIQVWSE